MAMNPGNVEEEITGIPTFEPSFHLPATWITESQRERAESLGYTVVDPPSIIATHLTEIIRQHISELLTRQDVQNIVNNIKDFLRLGGRRRDPQPARVDLVALCREAYGLFAADYEDAASGPVAFDVSRLRGAALEVFADETMTLQILWNLFGNDLKYAAPYGPVAVRFGRVADRAVLAFVDEGQGMTETQRRRAFDRYYRAKTVLQTGKGGFGIGLCTAREFARAMGGDLVVAANMPRGCVFTLTLPAAGAPSAGRRVPRESDGEANENERKGD